MAAGSNSISFDFVFPPCPQSQPHCTPLEAPAAPARAPSFKVEVPALEGLLSPLRGSANPKEVVPKVLKSKPPGSLLKHRLLGPTLRVSDSVRICISNKVPPYPLVLQLHLV